MNSGRIYRERISHLIWGKNIAILFWLSLNGEPCVRASVCELWTHLPRKDQPVQRLKSGVESTGQLDDCRFEPPNPEPPTDPRRAWSRASRRPERSGAKPVVFLGFGRKTTQNPCWAGFWGNTEPFWGWFLGHPFSGWLKEKRETTHGRRQDPATLFWRVSMGKSRSGVLAFGSIFVFPSKYCEVNVYKSSRAWLSVVPP